MLANIAYSCGFIYLFLSVFIWATRENFELSDKIAIVNGVVAVVGLVCGVLASVIWVWS